MHHMEKPYTLQHKVFAYIYIYIDLITATIMKFIIIKLCLQTLLLKTKLWNKTWILQIDLTSENNGITNANLWQKLR